MSKTFFTERKEFIYRMIDKSNHKTIKWSKEQMFAKKLFKKYPVDFLSAIGPPVFFAGGMNSIGWFITEKGSQYLDRQLKQFRFKPKKNPEVKEGVCEDIHRPKTKSKKLPSLREFLTNGKRKSN